MAIPGAGANAGRRQDGGQRVGELPVGGRSRRHHVDRALRLVAAHQKVQGADRVIQPDPTDRLPAAADHAAGACAEHRQQPLQHPRPGAEHRSQTSVRDADARGPCRFGRLLPGGRHLGQEAVAGRRGFVDRAFHVAVVADGRRGYQHRGWPAQPAERAAEQLGRRDAGSPGCGAFAPRSSGRRRCSPPPGGSPRRTLPAHPRRSARPVGSQAISPRRPVAVVPAGPPHGRRSPETP